MLKLINKHFFNKMPLLDKVEIELEAAKNQLLEAYSAKEWAETTVAYNLSRIKRLEGTKNEIMQGVSAAR